LRVDHQTGFAADLQKTGKNKKDKVNKNHNILGFTDLRSVVFRVELKTHLSMLASIGLPVVRICDINFFGNRFGTGQLSGLIWGF